MKNEQSTTLPSLPSHSTLWASIGMLRGGLFINRSSRTPRFLDMDRISKQKASGIMNLGGDNVDYVNVKEEVKYLPVLQDPYAKLPLYHIILTNILTLENLLPEPLEFCIVDPSGDTIDGAVLISGASYTITNCMFKKSHEYRISIRLSNSNFLFSTYEHSIRVCAVQ